MATKSTSNMVSNDGGGGNMRAVVGGQSTQDLQQRQNQNLSEGASTLSSVLSGFDDAALHIATYLPIEDMISLQSVSNGWNNILTKHEETLYENYLQSDFVEGSVLAYVARERSLSYKQLYIAFFKRWKLEEKGGTRLCIPWRRPATPRQWGIFEPRSVSETKTLVLQQQMDKDVTSLVFIARVGKIDNPESCAALMGWNPNPSNSFPESEASDRNHLLIDSVWKEAVGGLVIPENEEEMDYLTLHVLDIEKIMVVTLMEDTESSQSSYLGTSDGEEPYWVEHYYDGPSSTIQATNLYGMPPTSSPFYRSYSEEEYNEIDTYFNSNPSHGGWEWNDYESTESNTNSRYKNIECLDLQGGIALDVDENRKCTLDPESGIKALHFEFSRNDHSTLYYPSHISSYLRALMREKCERSIGVEALLQDSDGPLFTEQPLWVQTQNILDRVTSYCTFEEQAGVLRLVSRQFEASALRQLERKLLDETKVFGYSSHGWGDYFKARVVRGRSNDHLNSKESAIDDAIWLAKCQCVYESCDDKEKCPFANKARSVRDGKEQHVRHGKNIKTLDMEAVRESLAKTGRYQATAFRPDMWQWEQGITPHEIKSSFEQKSLTIFELCHEVMTGVHKNVDYYADDIDFEMDAIPSHFKKFYGVSETITSTRFIRSLFLVFAKAVKSTNHNQGDGGAYKRARLGESEEVTVGMASSNMPGGEKGYDYYSRMLTIYRFDNLAGEPMEIWFEKKSSTTGNE